jgi:acetate kinase
MTERVLVLNCGSSSIKYQLIDPSSGEALAAGLAERIGESEGILTHRDGDGERVVDEPIADHEAGMNAIIGVFADAGTALDEVGLTAVGHRVVHGGDRFADPTVLDDEVVDVIEGLTPLAPLHNPANLTGIRVARRLLPALPHVAVFDTAFHQTLPAWAYTYAVPSEWRSEHGVRRYGFHGTSVAYVSDAAARFLGRDRSELNLIVAHLGNGASITAVSGGRSVDTSMGLTPLEGLVMGTRSGDIDPALPAHLGRVAGLSAERVDEQLNRDSGLRALAGANDMREVHRRADSGDDHAALALDVYCYRLRKYVGAYYAVLGHVDAVIFTAGVGENDADIRARTLDGLGRLGIEVDPQRNASGNDQPRYISPPDAEVAVLVVPTNEELEIARQTLSATTGA